MSTKHFETFKGQRIYIRRQGANQGAFAIPSAQMRLATGIQERVQQAVNREGIQVPVDQYAISEDPQLTILYRAGQFQPEVMQFILGRVFEVQTAAQTLSYEEEITVPASGETTFPSTTATTELGSGVNLDNLVITTKNELGVTTLVTKVAWDDDGFAASATNSWMANNTSRTLRFTPDLVGRTVVLVCAEQFTNTLRLAGALTGVYEIGGILVNTSGRVWRFYAPMARPNLDGGQIDPAAEEVELTFRLFTPPGRCSAYDLVYLNKVVKC